METTTVINGISVKFPFQPYEIQKNYMEKVIDCLQNNKHGILESPTGTGKTLSLLCSSLAWLELKKAQVQLQRQALHNEDNDYMKGLMEGLEEAAGAKASGKAFIGLPTIVYASRTHSQLSQAMQELKRTSYSHMKACVLGSREQMCIHPDVVKEQNNSMKTHICRLKVKTRSCGFYNKVERKKTDPDIRGLNIVDIEDIVKLGETHKFCPYYMTRELKQDADIIFMPYNYLLDPKARKALGLELQDTVIILDEAHNIDSHCEESASVQIRSTDIALCVEEVTAVMHALDEEATTFNEDAARDFSPEELCSLKELLLNLEKELDAIELKKDKDGLTVFDGGFIFEFFAKVGINDGNIHKISPLLDKLVEFMATVNEGPFQRRGVGLQLLHDLLTIAFANRSEQFKEKVKKCYSVHVQIAEDDNKKRRTAGNWLTKLQTVKTSGRILSYWCFSPGFGMSMLLNQQVRCVILTSGTLAPLQPLITELEMKVDVRLENPHIVSGEQVCVKILKCGPDGEPLNCSFQNRDNPMYMASLGRSILNLIRVIPDGVLIFFPSYPIMLKCQQCWQENGIWSAINSVKPIYVEPKDKITFNNTMTEYYLKINDPSTKGAIFMGVCRGKVSEGLDFADMNGRAVIITGLPFPPLKDPRVILKRRYLDQCNARDSEYLKGQDWYTLEACRAVNQAVGRVIRHRYDYGAIILMDNRFDNFRIKGQMSKWLQNHIKVVNGFGQIMRDVREFFKNAQTKLPAPKPKTNNAEFSNTETYRKGGNFDFSTSASTSALNSTNLVNIQKRYTRNNEAVIKKRRIVVVSNPTNPEPDLETTMMEFISMVRKTLDCDGFKQLVEAMDLYKHNCDIESLIKSLRDIFSTRLHARNLLLGLQPYFQKTRDHSEKFLNFCDQMRQTL